MKKFNDMQLRIINYLSDGLWHSGSELGAYFNVSRTAIWKHIKHFNELGLLIERTSHRGYRLVSPFIPLQESSIREQLLHHTFDKTLRLHLYAALDSTNRYLKDSSTSHHIDICCAELQTEGRGRFGRQWFSPFGENIYCSSRWHFDCDLSRLSGLSLVVSLAILAMLKDIGIKNDIQVKWPNDILWKDKKLCGNLIEIIAESNSSVDVIIGIGLNVNSDLSIHRAVEPSLPDKPWCSLYSITEHYLDRNKLIAHLIHYLNHYLTRFLEHGFASFIAEWQGVDYLFGKKITVSHLTGCFTGIAQGVNEIGQLSLRDEKGVAHYLSSGDTSLQV